MPQSARTYQEFLEEAREIHASSIVIDTLAPKPDSELNLSPKYFEMIQQLVDEGLSRATLRKTVIKSLMKLLEHDPEFREQLTRLIRSSGVTAMSCSHAGAGPMSTAYPSAVRLIGYTNRLLQLFPDLFMPIYQPDDVETAFQEKKCGMIINFQNTQPIGDDIENLDVFFNLGVRVIQLTYNLRNLVGDGCTERSDGGLSYFGERVVHRMNDLGIVIDTSHCGDQTTLDAIETSRTPVAISHTFARALSDHPRGKTDDQLKALAARGGYVGVCVVPFFLTNGGNGSVDLVAEHIRYIADLIGPEHVGIGTDFTRSWELPGDPTKTGPGEQDWVGWRPEHRYGGRSFVEGLADYGEYPHLTAALLAKGFNSAEVQGIIGGNFLRFYRQVWSERVAD